MITKEIIIAGVQYPVTFEFQTLLNFEQITNSSFFETTFNKTVDRMALIMVGGFLGSTYDRSKLYDPEFATGYREASEETDK